MNRSALMITLSVVSMMIIALPAGIVSAELCPNDDPFDDTVYGTEVIFNDDKSSDRADNTSTIIILAIATVFLIVVLIAAIMIRRRR